jgi:pterin-4a-carbinolamine dehydratase/2-polyprenyl-3-methyl-5-hydroxy-6-metoxy-1,4-benzoquinol methylase
MSSSAVVGGASATTTGGSVTKRCSTAELLSDPKEVVAAPWILSYDTTSMSRSLVAKNWTAAMSFINAISEMAENQLHHHPDIHLTNYRHLQIVLTTHSVNGLTQLDVDLARAIDDIPVELSPQWLREQQEQAAAAGHDDEAMAVSFDQSHFPNGLNGDFVQPNAKEKFYGSSSSSSNNNNETTTTTTTTITATNGIFENAEQRDIAAAKHEIVQALRLTEGMVVADVGAGTGLLVPLLSAAVGGTGRVLVSELSPVFRQIIQERCRDLTNVHLVDNPTDRDPHLPAAEGTVDVVLLVDVYHHLEYPHSVLRRLRTALHRHGVLVVIDFHRDPARIKSHDATWVVQHLRADQATFTSEIERAGFVQVQEVNVPGLPENYFLVFRKRPFALAEPGAGWTW